MKFFCQAFLFLTSVFSLSLAQTHGTGTLYEFIPGIGACGFTNTSQQSVASVSNVVFNNYPGATANPNKNPICKRKLIIHDMTGTKNVTASIVDFFETQNNNNIGASKVVFLQFADESDGIVPNATWTIV